MNLGIVLNRVSFEEKQIIKACKKLGINVFQINNQRTFFELNTKQDLEKESDVILQRSLSLLRGLYSTRILETKGYRVINDYDSLHVTGDKILTSLRLLEHNIPTPLTYVAFTGKAALDNIETKLDYPLITKPAIGSWGRMVVKVENYNQALSTVESKEVMGNIYQKIHYFQEFIDSQALKKDAPTDIRAFYLGGEVIAAIGRYRQEKDFRSNVTLGGESKPYEITEEMQALCQKIAQAVGGEILGIDLMEIEDGFVCLEVNGIPGFQGLSTTTGVNIGERIAQYIKTKNS